jgi:general secretion pathway protein D
VAAAFLIWLAAILHVGCASMSGSQAKEPESRPGQIIGIAFESTADGDRVRILGNQPLTFNTVPDASGPGVQIHFPRTVLALADGRLDLEALKGAAVVTDVQPSALAEGDTAVVAIAVKHEAHFEAVPQGDEVLVIFPRPAPTPEDVAVLPQPLPAEAEAPLPDLDFPPATRLERIALRTLENGVEIHVRANGEIKNYASFTLTGPDRIVYDIFGLENRRHREEAIDGQPPWVSRVRHYGEKGKLRVVLDTGSENFQKANAKPVQDGLLIQVVELKGKDGGGPVAVRPDPLNRVDVAAPTPSPASPVLPVMTAVAPGFNRPDPFAGDTIQLAAATQEDAETPAASAGSEAVEFNFDNAELNEVIRTLANILEIQYVADPNLQGKVTIHTSRPMNRKDLFPLFFKILEINGLTAVKDGPVYRIAAVKDVSRIPIGFRGAPARSGGLPAGQQVVIQLIPLRNLSPGEMAKIVAPFASENATVVAQEEARTLLVVDSQDNVRKILRIVEAFDLNLFSRVHHQFYFLEHSLARETAETLQEIFSGGAEEGASSTRFIPVERLNAVLALSTDPDVFAHVNRLMLQLDGSGRSTEPRIEVYFVKNGTADELADLLNQIFTGQQGSSRDGLGGSEKAYSFSRNPFARTSKTTGTSRDRTSRDRTERSLSQSTAAQMMQTTSSLTSQGAGEPSATLKAPVTIIPDPIRNALVIEATPVDYAKIEGILHQLDILPRQVLIEATIAEISLEDKMELGVEWEYLRENNFSRTDLVRGKVTGATGLTYAIEFSNDVLHSLEALAQKDKVNILSSPHVLASDNKEAKIDVADEIPIISSETTVTSSAEPLITTDIQYRDTGVMLSVVPHINDRGLVTMDIYQEVSELADNVEVAGVSYPSFYKRTVETTLTVAHGQTIVLGGLIRENKSGGRSGVPYLMDIPILGYVFGSTSRNMSKTELIILLTPQVIADLDDVNTVTESFERKVSEAINKIAPKP